LQIDNRALDAQPDIVAAVEHQLDLPAGFNRRLGAMLPDQQVAAR
jgi:hypothetical protein